MNNATKESMILCSVSEVAKATAMRPPTVRKYSQMMEKAGYTFHKNELGHRGYFERDSIVMNRIKEASKNSNISLENAVKIVVSTIEEKPVQGNDIQNTVVSTHEFDEHKKKMEEVKQLVKEQNELIKNMVKRNDQLLLKSLDQSQEIKQLEQQKNKSWWKF